jgi:DNA polymerase V
MTATKAKKQNTDKRKDSLNFFSAEEIAEISRPYFEEGIKAGFPSPAGDFAETSIDLNKELIQNPNATFYARVCGDSMMDMGIDDGDLLVIDKSKEPSTGKVAVCFIDGEFTLKQIKLENDFCLLLPANKKYEPLKVNADNNFFIWGIVTYVIKKL